MSYDDQTLNFCLADGSRLIPSDNEPATEIITGSAGARPLTSKRSAAVGETAKSIAVLPFAHFSSDPDDEFFCDGLAEEFLNALTRVDGLKVAARTSSFSFKGKNANVGEIGRELGVATVLEGSLRKSGNRLRISVQLINTVDGYHLWSERYDREMRDIFDLQDEITLAVVEALKVKLLGSERSAMLKKGTDNSEAFDLYIRGRALWNKRTHADLDQAISYFQRAIEIDPTYARAYSGLADSYAFLAYFEACAPGLMRDKVRAAVEKASSLDPDSAESHSSRATYLTFFEFDPEGAERELMAAIALNPHSPTAHYWYCSTLTTEGRFDEAIKIGRTALQMDPLSPVADTALARALCCVGRYDEAIQLANQSFEIVPDFFFSNWILGWAYGGKGLWDDAVSYFEKSIRNGGFTIYGYLGNALVRSGRSDDARLLLDELHHEAEHGFVSPVAPAIIEASLGNMPRGLELIEKAWQMGIIHLMWAGVDPVFDIFRPEPSFQAICKAMHLPMY